MLKLDYLFRAFFADGSTIYQTAQDCSRDQPLTRSAFYDVQQRLADVRAFALVNGSHEYRVDLANGDFLADGQRVPNPWSAAAPDRGALTPGAASAPALPLSNFRLIYFRRVENTLVLGREQSQRVVAYFIGWQANDTAGKNFQAQFEIPPTGSLTRPRLHIFC